MKFDLTQAMILEERETADGIVNVVTGRNVYISLKQGQGPEIWLWQGGAFDVSGQEVRELPDWFFEEALKITDPLLREVGWYEKVREEREAGSREPEEGLKLPKNGKRGV